MKTAFSTLLLWLLPSLTQAVFRCLFQRTQRCGFLKLGVTVRIGEPNTEACIDFCTYMIEAPFECGTCGTIPSDDYDITLDLATSIPLEDRDVFFGAAQKWQSIITVGLFPGNTFGALPPVDITPCVYPSVVDDLYICARYLTLDDGIFATSGITYVRRSGILPVIGDITVNAAIVGSVKALGTFSSLISYAMAGILGLGSQWDNFGLIDGAAPNCVYNGAVANAAYQAISGCSSRSVPLETNLTGDDMRLNCMLWDRACFQGNEILSIRSFTNVGPKSLISTVTIGGLADLGYTVEKNNADNLQKSDLNPNCTCTTRRSLPATAERTVPAAPYRRLSDQGHQQAVAYGKKLLAARRGSSDVAASSDAAPTKDSIKYVGDQQVTVFFMENNSIFPVNVVAS